METRFKKSVGYAEEISAYPDFKSKSNTGEEYTLLIRDSVFSAFDNPYKDEKPISSQKAIAVELDRIEKPAATLFEKTWSDSLSSAVTSLSVAIASGDEKIVQKYKWSLKTRLAGNLWGEWLLGFKTGRDRGEEEVEGRPNTFGRCFNVIESTQSTSKDNLAQFAQPEPSSDILRNRPAEAAIKARTNTLARDVSDSEWLEIKQVIIESISPVSSTENPISRRELLRKINEKLGDRKNRFKNRAETIARTELTFAYNAGRLDSYVRSGLVSGIKYQTIFDERRCQICASRQGIIVALDDIEGLAKLAIPAHPRCRCVWSPVLKTEFDIEGKKKNRQIKNRKLVPGKSWLAGGIIAALLIPEELALVSVLSVGIKKLIEKAASPAAARAAIALKINNLIKRSSFDTLEITDPVITPRSSQAFEVSSTKRNFLPIAPEDLRSIVPTISNYQIDAIARADLKSFQDLSKILDKNQLAQIKTVARENALFNLLHPSNNINPSAIWVNSGGIISKKQSKAVYDLIRDRRIETTSDLLLELKSLGIDTAKLNQYAIARFDRLNGLSR